MAMIETLLEMGNSTQAATVAHTLISPGASDDHQLHNARAMERAGAARLVLDAEMTGAKLVEEVTRLRADRAALEAMSAAARTFAKPGAASRAATILEDLAAGLPFAAEAGI